MQFKPRGVVPMFEADWFCTCGVVLSIKAPVALVASQTGLYHRCHACRQRWIVREDGAQPVEGEPMICFECRQNYHEICRERNRDRDRGDCDCQHRVKQLREIDLSRGVGPLGITQSGHPHGYVNGDDTNAGSE